MYSNAHVAEIVDSYCESVGALNLPTTVNKSDVAEALRGPKPVDALTMIIEKKATDPTYTRRDAREDVKGEAKKPEHATPATVRKQEAMRCDYGPTRAVETENAPTLV
jgi:hypothetical protein